MRSLIFVLFVLVYSPVMAQEAEQYTCPMHPHYIADQMGTCPICGMDLVPAKADTNQSPGSGVIVSSEMIQTMGIRAAPVRMQSVGDTIRSFGNVMPSTRLETVVASRVEGWIEDLAVSAEGDAAAAGDLLYSVYSPDLIAAQRDFINALKSGSVARSSATERRLKSLGMQSGVIASVRKSRTVIERLPVYAEEAGVVSYLAVRDGDYIKPGAPIMRLQNYERVWIVASVAEKDMRRIKKDTSAVLSLPDISEERQGKVDYVYPTIDEATRTGKVRIVAANEEGLLKPGGYADVTFAVGEQMVLAVPTEAILHGSDGAHVVTMTSDQAFKPVIIRTGISANGYTAVEAGLAEGDMVVVSGQFLLDSEASLREGFRKMTPATSLIEMDRETPLSKLPVNAETLALIDHFVDAGLYFHEALNDNYRVDPFFLEASLKAGEGLLGTFGDTRLAPVINEAMQTIEAAQRSPEADDHKTALREALASLVIALEPWFLDGAPIHYRDLGLALFRDEASGNLWVQEGDAASNPFGNGPSVLIEWPDPMAGMAQDNPDPSHAGHVH
ncbi:efflux RND transporter periplasmic adaptor subunit [Parvularcula sp. IMCC14364]|uniref:efflux RND transporter periplasmic adaptor subunit n=1 Tax=Parvularcula sp. IMCC14364 TaxID=3067902 RepID=UPI0027421D3D|nr:efflux RND transporter periplasmic adaptor subunit [Parvularcula sp. IMCC14364]